MPGGSLYDSHGDVLVAKVHKNNSLEHLSTDRFGPRPTSAAWTRYTKHTKPTVPGMAGRRPAPVRPQSAGARMHQSAPQYRSAPSIASSWAQPTKSQMAKIIDGDAGPCMKGVTTYPYSQSQRLYLEDFRALIATTIDHPFQATTAFNEASVPHDILSGSNYDDDRMGGIQKKWRSEYGRAFEQKSIVASKRAPSCGVRSEQFQFLG